MLSLGFCNWQQPDVREQTVKTATLKGPGRKAYNLHLSYKTRMQRIVTIIHCVRKLGLFIYAYIVKPILTPLHTHTVGILASEPQEICPQCLCTSNFVKG